MDDDLALLQRWRDNDQRAGEELCRRRFDEIHRFFKHKVPEEADDLTQETLEKCVRNRDQFLGRSTFRTYLFTIARNVLNDRLRRIPKFQQVDLDVSSLDELVSSPSSQLRRHEELAQVQAALRQLPVEQQVLLELRFWHDLDAAALAEVYETSAGTIRVRLLRARRALLARFGQPAPGAAADPLTTSLFAEDNDDD